MPAALPDLNNSLSQSRVNSPAVAIPPVAFTKHSLRRASPMFAIARSISRYCLEPSSGYASALSPTPSASESLCSLGSFGSASSPSATPSLSSSLSSTRPVVESLAVFPSFQKSGAPSKSLSMAAAAVSKAFLNQIHHPHQNPPAITVKREPKPPFLLALKASISAHNNGLPVSSRYPLSSPRRHHR